MADGTPADTLRKAMDDMGMRDNALRAGLAAIVGAEGGFHAMREIGYAHTDNGRIRGLFSAARNMSDARLNALKARDEDFFEAMYGVGTETGRQLGNAQPGDGYKYRGRWQIQLTGRANYTRYLTLAGRSDLIEDPDRANADIELGARLAVAYMLDRYHGGGFDAMKRAVGNSIGGPDNQKNTLFAHYMQTGEWDWKGGGSPISHARPVLRHGDRNENVRLMQRELIADGYDCGRAGADGDFGDGTAQAVLRFRQSHGLSNEPVCDEAMWHLLSSVA